MNCKWCQEDIKNVNTCIENPGLIVDKRYYTPIPFMPINPKGRKCPECKVKKFAFHHPGCPVERCPYCSGQLINCACNHTIGVER